MRVPNPSNKKIRALLANAVMRLFSRVRFFSRMKEAVEVEKKEVENPKKDFFDLNRFVFAQDGHYQQALREVKAGDKRSHWMWYIFPQLLDLGSSYMAHKYAIRSYDEAKAYLEHPILGARIVECTKATVGTGSKNAIQIFGHTDALKFKSSCTLFEFVSKKENFFEDGKNVFHSALKQFFNGKKCTKSVAFLEQEMKDKKKKKGVIDWDAVAKSYKDGFFYQFSPHPLVEKLIEGEKVKTLLDVGCGTGEFCKRMTEKDPEAKVIGIDCSAEFLRLVEDPVQAELVDLNKADVRYFENRFSHITASISLMFVDDIPETVKLLASLLETNGKLIIACWGERKNCTAVDAMEKAWGKTVAPSNWKLSDLKYLKGLVEQHLQVEVFKKELIRRSDESPQSIAKGWKIAATPFGMELNMDDMIEIAKKVDVEKEVMEINIIVGTRKSQRKIK